MFYKNSRPTTLQNSNSIKSLSLFLASASESYFIKLIFAKSVVLFGKPFEGVNVVWQLFDTFNLLAKEFRVQKVL